MLINFYELTKNLGQKNVLTSKWVAGYRNSFWCTGLPCCM